MYSTEALEAGSLSSNPYQSAFSLENEAYKTSASRDQYDSACRNAAARGAAPTVEAHEASINDGTQESPGITIGRYSNCHYFASGVTAEVYRCKTVALKVIVDGYNMEPHNPQREAKILGLLKKPCIPLLETFRDQEQRFTLAFPFMPLSLENLIRQGPLPKSRVRSHFRDLFGALRDIHEKGIIHRDIKPSALLLESPDGPAYLSDFGTAWHPTLSISTEPAHRKILDIGTGPYRAPEVLFGNKSYGPPVDMWGAGVMLAECCRDPPRPLFESRPVSEDGNQLGLILSIFKTIGSPTPETWPEALDFLTPPFETYQSFQGEDWANLLSGVDGQFQELIMNLVTYESSQRPSAAQLFRQGPGLAAKSMRLFE
ncbi:hypothetical protein DL767_005448 [Monosporascus sp. MG133]|nr:hypothetical protein DL767_005448 [Monosporascus sp. MG133]